MKNIFTIEQLNLMYKEYGYYVDMQKTKEQNRLVFGKENK